MDVPLPLRLGLAELPVVGDEPGVAELAAAGSPLVDPGPLGAPPCCAYAKEPQSASAAASAIVGSFMAFPSDDQDNPKGKAGFQPSSTRSSRQVQRISKKSQLANNRLPRALASDAV